MDDATEDDGPPGNRRAFLMGSLLGVGVTAGLTQGARMMRSAADPAPAGPRGADDDPAALAPGQIPPLPDDLGPMAPDGRRLSYAQQGEDLVLQAILEHLHIDSPRYLDIGAFHPSISSNTFLFYARGGRGVLVEPNPFMAGLLRRARPRDTVLDVGVSVDGRTSAEYYVIRDRPQLNTFSREQADRYVAQTDARAVERVVSMPLRSIDDILGEHFADAAPDLLSVDVEGLDLPLLQTLSFDRFRPAVLCVETLVYGTAERRDPILALLAEHDYQARASTFVNTIFVDARRLAGAAGPR